MTEVLKITVDAADRKELARKLSDRRTKLGPQVAVTARPIQAYVGRIGHAAVRYAKEEAPKDLGALKRSIRFRFSGGSAATVTASAEHATYVIDGRRPGSFPPIGKIRAWVVRRGMPESAAFPVARKIAEKGIDPNDFLGRAFVRMLRKDVPMSKRQFVSDTEREWSS